MCTFNKSRIIKSMRNLIILKLKANGYIHVGIHLRHMKTIINKDEELKKKV